MKGVFMLEKIDWYGKGFWQDLIIDQHEIDKIWQINEKTGIIVLGDCHNPDDTKVLCLG